MLLYKIVNNRYRSKQKVARELKKLDEDYRRTVMLIDKKKNASRSRSFIE